MAAPLKPWERGVGQNNRGFGNISPYNDTGFPVNQHTTTNPVPGSSSGPSFSRAPPPLPTRPSQQVSAFGSPVNRYGGYGGYGGGGYGGYGSSMGGYGSSMGGYGTGSYGGMYGGGSMYSPYGGGMHGGSAFGQGQFGPNGDCSYNRFLRQAEENSRPAFQSIESIVQAFGSISMMMESTFQTVYNSFRAVIGVADHFSRLKVHLAHVFTALALFRTIRYAYRRILAFLGLRSKEYAEELWKEAQSGGGEIEKLGGKKKPDAPSWPIFMFFAVVVGGPYIIWKLLCSTEESEQEQPGWASGEEDHVVARAEFDLDAEGNNELSFKAGAMLNLAPKELQPKVRGWVLASVNGQSTGLVPANYIKILGKRRGKKSATLLTDAPQPKDQGSKLETVSETSKKPLSSETMIQSDGLSVPKSNSEVNLEAFDSAFEDTPVIHQTEEGGMQAGMDNEWSAWEKESTPDGNGTMDSQSGDKSEANE